MSNLDNTGKNQDKSEIKQHLIDIEKTSTKNNELTRGEKTNQSERNLKEITNNTENNLGIEDYARISWKFFMEKIWNKVDDENKVCCVCSSMCCCFIIIFLFYTLFILG